ncbi:MAG TPA: hypothetical protein VG122_05080 [Gemmata sp.]|jgi:hypothetical protein|nr:hypothetical protein [Gemmata sp.]
MLGTVDITLRVMSTVKTSHRELNGPATFFGRLDIKLMASYFPVRVNGPL